MKCIDLIRERWHNDSTTPEERAFLTDLMAAIREDVRRAVKDAREPEVVDG